MSSVRDDSDAHHGIARNFTLLLYADVSAAPAAAVLLYLWEAAEFEDLQSEDTLSSVHS